MSLKKQNEFKKDPDTIILGCGYIGSFFLEKHSDAYYTSRKNKLINIENKKQIYFNLQDESSWKNIPYTKNVLWTFSAANNENEILKSLEFFNEYLKNRNVMVLSSTSAYFNTFENEFINEDSKILLNEARFYAEEKLRNHGALILHLSGIIGPGRSPLNWYIKNLVSYGENILNYIHVHDIIYFIENLFKSFKHSERFNLTSQDYKTHNIICSDLIKKGLFESNFEFIHKNESKKSKKVQCNKILEYLNEKNYKFKKYPEDVEI